MTTRTHLDLATRFPHLRTMDLLRGLDSARADHFINACRVRQYSLPTPVLTQDILPDSAYIVAKGAVEVSYVSQDGHRAIIGLYRAAQVLGVFESIAGKPCAATAKAMPETVLLAVPNPILDQFLEEPTFQRNLAAIACDILQRDNTAKAVDQFYSAEQRICIYLRTFAGSDGTFCQNQSYLANIVGCTRQTVNRELGQLRAEGIICQEGGTIRILDPEALSRRIRALESQSGTGQKRRG